MNPEQMVAESLARRKITPNLVIVEAGNNTVDVFTDHDYREHSRYGFHKERWHYQKGNRLTFMLFKEMVDAVAREN